MPIRNAMRFMLMGMKNGEYKVPMFGSEPLGGSSWRLVVGEILDVWSLHIGGCGRPNVMRKSQSEIYT